MKAVMLLCDHAAVENGKLYINGGGWSQVRAGMPSPMALAIKFDIDWTEANRPHAVLVRLITEDGHPVLDPEGDPYQVVGKLEVGRPAGLRAGVELDAALAVNFPHVTLEPGGYRWELSADEQQLAQVSLQAFSLP